MMLGNQHLPFLTLDASSTRNQNITRKGRLPHGAPCYGSLALYQTQNMAWGVFQIHAVGSPQRETSHKHENGRHHHSHILNGSESLLPPFMVPSSGLRKMKDVAPTYGGGDNCK